jgi:O-antigen ligase
LGVGLGGYNRAAHQYTPVSFSYINEYYQQELLKGIVHNEYLLLAAETGLIGVLFFVYVAWRFFRLAYPLGRWRDPVFLALAIGLSASIVAQAVFFLFDPFYADVRHYMLFVFFGLSHALTRIHGEAPHVRAGT